MKGFRSVLKKIQTCIEAQNGATESQLKDIWNELSNAITENEKKVLSNVDGWIEFNSNKKLFNSEAAKNCLCLFEDGTVIRYNEDHPLEVMTHFKLVI